MEVGQAVLAVLAVILDQVPVGIYPFCLKIKMFHTLICVAFQSFWVISHTCRRTCGISPAYLLI